MKYNISDYLYSAFFFFYYDRKKLLIQGLVKNRKTNHSIQYIDSSHNLYITKMM